MRKQFTFKERFLREVAKAGTFLIPNLETRRQVRQRIYDWFGVSWQTKNFMVDELMFVDKETRKYPQKFFSVKETMDLVLERKMSIARIGDGEFSMIMGRKMVWNRFDDKLSKRLAEICSSGTTDKCVVCLNSLGVFSNMHNESSQWFVRYALNNIEDILSLIKFSELNPYGNAYAWLIYCEEKMPLSLLNKNNTHFFTRPNETSIAKIRTFFSGRNILFVCNRDSLVLQDDKNLKLFCGAKKQDFCFVPPKDAFNEYERILSEIKSHDTDWLVYMEAGAVATLLAVDLSEIGYQALDMGDFYRRISGIASHDLKNVEKFLEFHREI